ncbi:hypothetical protein PLICRDRAFT_607673 [Plicaturopsis crispa FD-325 SS-3]|nr:hypothetical protein PLICRDRAFT_607673 [Plicaturopsis crispa FD-325 SS-3]
MDTSYFLCICSILLITVIAWLKCIPSSRHTTAESIRALLAPPQATLARLLLSRATPNARLVHAFGITSTFVSPHVSVHSDFVGRATAMMNAVSLHTSPHWHDTAVETARMYLPAPASTVAFDDFMRAVTFTVVIVGLLGADPACVSAQEVVTVTRGINDLWQRSKTGEHIPGNELERINRCLERWVPDRERFPYPLDFIIPAYETLWRVVALGFVHAHADERARAAFAAFHENRSLAQFQDTHSDTRPSVDFFMTEVLRVYPPTKHVGRAVPRFPPFLSGVLPECSALRYEMADIETVQRSSVWGDDASAFDPMRHHPGRQLSSHSGDRALLAFGVGPLKCIAQKWAPAAAAVILASILDVVDGDKFAVGRGPSIGGRDGWDGWSIRSI